MLYYPSDAESTVKVPESSMTKRDKEADCDTCFGCGEIISDIMVVCAGEHTFHSSCFHCFECKKCLANEWSCFHKNKKFYCKDDYFRYIERIRNVNTCGRCGLLINPGESIIRSEFGYPYHLKCFTCNLCGRTLNYEDEYIPQDKLIFCMHHSDQIMQMSYNYAVLNEDTSRSSDGYMGLPNDNTNIDTAINYFVPLQTMKTHNESEDMMHAPSFMSSSGLNLMSDSTEHVAIPYAGIARVKRPRTSFKHGQIRIMKNYFTINQNPDAKDLKALSQKTGLSKRVLQVWFQNARAKFRRDSAREGLAKSSSCKRQEVCDSSSPTTTTNENDDTPKKDEG